MTKIEAGCASVPPFLKFGKKKGLASQIKKKRHFIVIIVLLIVLLIVIIVLVCLLLTKNNSQPRFEKFVIGGSEGSPSNQVQKSVDSTPCEFPAFNPQHLVEPLEAHFAVATQEGLVVGGGVSGLDESNHTARSVYFLAYNSSTWIDYPKLKHPRIQSCVSVEGNKIFVHGGTLLDAEMPCDLSTEMLDLDHLEDGWQLTDPVADGVFRTKSSYCSPPFICYNPVSVEIPC